MIQFVSLEMEKQRAGVSKRTSKARRRRKCLMKGLVLQLLLIVLQEGRPKAVFSIHLGVMAWQSSDRRVAVFATRLLINNRSIASECGGTF
jgi:hypothetical protein